MLGQEKEFNFKLMKYFEELKRSMNYLAENNKTIFIGQAVEVPGTAMSNTLKEKIINNINNNNVILFMKGTKDMPMCGFSAKVVNTLNSHSVVFQDVNILEDPDIRVQLSEYSNWPTIPQLFVKGELIGGCDIVMEMDSKGELKEILNKVV